MQMHMPDIDIFSLGLLHTHKLIYDFLPNTSNQKLLLYSWPVKMDLLETILKIINSPNNQFLELESGVYVLLVFQKLLKFQPQLSRGGSNYLSKRHFYKACSESGEAVVNIGRRRIVIYFGGKKGSALKAQMSLWMWKFTELKEV